MVREITSGSKKKKSPDIMLVIGALLIVALVSISTAPVYAQDITRPTIIEVTPKNNELNIGTHDVVTVRFSEEMNPQTINKNTFIVEQRTTPYDNSQPSAFRSMQVEGTITYDKSSHTATFTPDKGKTANPLQPNQRFGNVFTATIKTGTKDIRGNSISQNYVWSFSTGDNSFNTGNSTSQQQQITVPVKGTMTTAQPNATTPIITGAAAGTTQTTGTSSPWNWLLLGLVMLTLGVLVTALVINPRKKKIEKLIPVPAKKSNPFGDIHYVKEIEGIGSQYSKALFAMGINNTKQLWEANTEYIAQQTGAPIRTVKSWQNMAELAAIHDIGPQYAELLERSGIHNISELKNCRPNQLLKLVNKKQDSINMSIQGNVPGHALVENWIDQAQSHIYSVRKGQKA